MNGNALRRKILSLVERHVATRPKTAFVPGVTPVPVSGRVYDADEVKTLVAASLDFWLTAGPYADKLERGLERYVGVRHAVLCNSGSSANLLAVSALTSPKLGERRLRPGDEVLAVAAGFPTTVNPLVQSGLVPVFVDVMPGTWNADPRALEAAVTPRTKAIMLAHTLGNPFDLDAVTALAQRHNLWLVEDNCDALGSLYRGRLTGTFGDLATLSFYPAHHITTGEGGCVLASTPRLKTLVESFRDWGRDCWCAPGWSNTCGKRFEWKLGDLPLGYDHKYIYSHIGYNLKLTDLQAAVGVAQLKKLPGFGAARRRNWRRLREGMADLEEFFLLPDPTPGADPSWFGFLLAVRPGAPFARRDVVARLEERKIATRLLFGGDLTRQPAYRGVPHRVVGDLRGTDLALKNAFWVGVYPGLSDAQLDYTLEVLHAFCRPPSVGARGPRKDGSRRKTSKNT